MTYTLHGLLSLVSAYTLHGQRSYIWWWLLSVLTSF